MSRSDDRRHLSEDLIWALRLVRLGGDEETIVRAITRHHPKHGYHSRMYQQTLERRGSVEARRYAVKTAQKAAEIAKGEPRVFNPYEARQRLQEIWAQVDAEPWPIELAGARRALEAAFSIAFERGFVANLHLSIRDHAMRAGQSFAAIRRHRDTLVELGWLRRNPFDRGNRTSRFSFSVPAAHVIDLPGVLTCAGGVRPAVLLAHDAFRPEALGDSGSFRFQYFARQPEIEDEVLEYLDLIALRHATANTGYHEGMTFLEQRRTRAAVITCAEAERRGA